MTTNPRWKVNVDDKLDIVLVYVHRNFSVRKIAKYIHKSIGTVQAILEYAEEKGFCVNENPGKHGGRVVTEKGEAYVKQRGSFGLYQTSDPYN